MNVMHLVEKTLMLLLYSLKLLDFLVFSTILSSPCVLAFCVFMKLYSKDTNSSKSSFCLFLSLHKRCKLTPTHLNHLLCHFCTLIKSVLLLTGWVAMELRNKHLICSQTVPMTINAHETCNQVSWGRLELCLNC